MNDIKTLKEELDHLKYIDMCNEMTDNFYYTSGRKKEFMKRIKAKEAEYKELKEKS